LPQAGVALAELVGPPPRPSEKRRILSFFLIIEYDGINQAGLCIMHIGDRGIYLPLCLWAYDTIPPTRALLEIAWRAQMNLKRQAIDIIGELEFVCSCSSGSEG